MNRSESNLKHSFVEAVRRLLPHGRRVERDERPSVPSRRPPPLVDPFLNPDVRPADFDEVNPRVLPPGF